MWLWNSKSIPTKKECLCCLSVTEIDRKRNEKGVRCITLSLGFQANRLDIDVLETSFYEYKETHGPSKEDEEIHEYAYRKAVASWIGNKC